MCTVTFVPTKKGFILSSNRDEKSARATLSPTFYKHGNVNLVYPKDEVAGGTWIASNVTNRIACLLNGAFEAHEKKESYNRSRGKVLLEAFDFDTHEDFVELVNLVNVEPFTLLLIDFDSTIKISELRWDGVKLHYSIKDNKQFHIWSSATLYSAENRSNRKKWFTDWITKYKEAEDYNILNFHLQKHSEKEDVDIVMRRDDGIQTVSVTQFIITNEESLMYSLDLLKNTQSMINLKEAENGK